MVLWFRLKQLDPATFTGDVCPDLSDVYVYVSDYGLTCCGCRLVDWFETVSRTAMIDHLHEHEQAGHQVPRHVFDMLRDEIDEDGDEVVH